MLFIDTAAEERIGKEDGDDDWLQADLQSLRNQGYRVERYTITGKTKEEVEKEIEKHDILYMCGGDTAYLLHQLRKTDTFGLVIQKVKNGTPYIGTSAGSIICGPRLPDYLIEETDLEDKTCFNFVNFTLVPHWGSPHFKEKYLGERLPKVYKPSEGPFLILTDTQYVQVLDDGSFKIVTT